jgi:sulfonate transport system substrate-binding protein
LHKKLNSYMKLRIGAVPEHFFFPFKKWLNEGGLSFPIQFELLEYPNGSGAMHADLLDGKLDLAFVLTEAAAFARIQQKAVTPLSLFVTSPLNWGIFTGINRSENSISQFQQPIYAISRFGSGSHLMAMVDAKLRGGSIQESQWLVVENLEGAREALTSGKADLFFWEKWTTKPLVDGGEFRMLDVRPSPWSSFVLTTRAELSKDQELIRKIRLAINEVLTLAKIWREETNASEQIARFYGLQETDTADWLKSVSWAEYWHLPEDEIQKAESWIRVVIPS